MKAFYNENCKYAAEELRTLISSGRISPGAVSEKSIYDVSQEDVSGFTKVHLFSGIAGWELALKMAEWPEDIQVWTGSCPCQPFSNAGKGLGEKDDRHLWPEMFRLVRECRPGVVFGEQVASAIGHGWLDNVFGDLEGEGYSCGAVVLGAHSVGAPHSRQRLWWVANSAEHGLKRLQHGPVEEIQKNWTSEALGAWDRPGDTFKNWRKLLGESSVRRMDDGVSSTVDVRPRLHAYGNSIVPQVAAVFVRSFMETHEFP